MNKNIIAVILSIIILITVFSPSLQGIKKEKNIQSKISRQDINNKYIKSELEYQEYYPGAPLNNPKVVYYKPNEVIVSFKQNLIEVFLGMIFLEYKIIDIIPELNAGLLEVLAFPPGINDILGFLNFLLTFSEVESAELNTVCSGAPASLGDADYEQWGQEVIKIPEAWDITKGEYFLSIAIADSGIDHNHQNLPMPTKEIDLIEH